MKVRLIVHEDQIVGRSPDSGIPWLTPPTLWPVDIPIPEGWEEVDLVPPCRGTTLQEARAMKEAERDPCECDDDRRSHVEHKGRCLARKHATQCGCLRFREKRQ